MSLFPLKISISQDLVSHFNDPEVIYKIRNESGATKITINQNLDSSSYTESVISIFGTVMQSKISAMSMVRVI
jgi:hypothetical protein